MIVVRNEEWLGGECATFPALQQIIPRWVRWERR